MCCVVSGGGLSRRRKGGQLLTRPVLNPPAPPPICSPMGRCVQLTAKASFTHMIQRERRPEHKLVTWGIYRCAAVRSRPLVALPLLVGCCLCVGGASSIAWAVRTMRARVPVPVHCHPHRRYIRHPGYLGWLVWAVGTQVMLVNPLCTLLFAVVVSRGELKSVVYFNTIDMYISSGMQEGKGKGIRSIVVKAGGLREAL